MNTLTIGLEGMRFFAFHGCYAEEKVNGNWFEVQVTITVEDNLASQTDRLEDTTDYGLIYKICKEEMEIRRNLLEKVCWEIGTRILQEGPEIIQAEIKVIKQNPPIAGEVRESWVSRTFFQKKASCN